MDVEAFLGRLLGSVASSSLGSRVLLGLLAGHRGDTALGRYGLSCELIDLDRGVGRIQVIGCQYLLCVAIAIFLRLSMLV